MPKQLLVPLRFAWIFAALVAALLALAPLAAAKPLPRDFVGVSSEDVFAGDAAYRDANLAAQSGMGIGLIRQAFDWASIETAPGQYNLGYHDGFVAAAATHGVTILPILFHAPEFRVTRHSGKAACPPQDNASLAAYAQALVRRYGPSGTLWSERPDLPRLPIRSWQIWNEPNLGVYWCNKPSAKQYASMLRTVGAAIKQVDSGAQIVTAGLPDSKLNGAVPLIRFIDQLYRAGAAKYFDSLAINSYARDEGVLGRLLGSVRKRMNANRDRGGQIWITEIGWGDRIPGRSTRLSSGRKARPRGSPPLSPSSVSGSAPSVCVASSTSRGAMARRTRRTSRTCGAYTPACSTSTGSRSPRSMRSGKSSRAFAESGLPADVL